MRVSVSVVRVVVVSEPDAARGLTMRSFVPTLRLVVAV
jgi:hypothetical protein